MLNAEIIAIGSELLTPYRSDTNSLWLTERLNSIGIGVRLKSVVGDDETDLEHLLRDALKRSDVVITTGGLGPTEDDVTRKVLARVSGRQLLLDYEILAEIRERFASRGYQMTPNNERQALVPRGSDVLPNSNGTAPGISFDHDGRMVVALPGPPRENQPMFDNHVMPALRRKSRGARQSSRVLKVVGLGESALDDLIAPIYRKHQNPVTTILFTSSEIEIHLTAIAQDLQASERLVEGLSDELVEKLGDSVYSTTGEKLEEVVGLRMRLKRYSLATAESLTGGLVAERLTQIPGASEYFLGSVVCYATETKTRLLGVPRGMIDSYSAVSGEVAEAMASGIKERTGATIGLSLTGIAGPTGATEGSPVGTVYVGLADDVGTSNKRLVLPGDRELIRWRASTAALDLVRRRYLL
jgi:nicotinamide-nucleotide amidase